MLSSLIRPLGNNAEQYSIEVGARLARYKGRCVETHTAYGLFKFIRYVVAVKLYKNDKRCMCNVTVGRVRANVVAVEKQ